MKRAKCLSSLRPTIILCIIAFLLTIILPLESARCDDRCIVIINGKKIDDPVVVPDMDFGEPGDWPTCPYVPSDNLSRDKIGSMPESGPEIRIKSYWFFLRYMLNQILCGN